jgi:putative membrane protein
MHRCIRLLLILFVGVGLVAPAAAAAAAAPAPGVSRADAKFMRGNAHVDLAEITIGNIALARSDNAVVRDLATTTIGDHQVALAKLTALAAEVGVTLPDQPNTSQRNVAARLSSVAPEKFDLLYVQVQIAGHLGSIAATRTEIADGTSPEVIAFAKAYLPVAEMHLKMARHALRDLT